MLLAYGLLLLKLLLIIAAAGAQSLADDRRALTDFFWATGGNSTWRKATNWLVDSAALTSVCDWHGVGCGPPLACMPANASAECRVISLLLRANSLTGSLPTSFGRLNALQSIDLAFNQIGGTLPVSIGMLTALRSLDLLSNRIGGTLPESLGALSALRWMYLSTNRFEGTIPAMPIGNMSSLYVLLLSFNRFTGHLDNLAELGRMPTLDRLDLSNNPFFGGPLPKWLLNMSTNLRALKLEGTGLVGALPLWIGQMSSLQEIDLSENNLDGTLPSVLGNLSRLIDLRLSFNPLLAGSIPNSIGDLSELTTLRLDGMALSGSVPRALRNCGKLISLNLNSNRLSGSMPSEILRIPSLTFLYLKSNMLSGSVLETGDLSPLLREIHLQENVFSGTVSSFIGNLTFLRTLNVSFNSIAGELPDSVGRLRRLKVIDIRSNQFSGRIPPRFGADCSEIYLGSNALMGQIPSTLCSASPMLTTIDFSNNQLNGFDPLALFSCPNLVSVDLSRNRLLQNVDLHGVVSLPRLVNLSSNLLGPELAKYVATSSATSPVASIDLSSNVFQCPLPNNYPLTIALLLSPCIQPWRQLLVYAAIFLGSFALCLAVSLVAVRSFTALSAFIRQSHVISFWVSWAGECVGLVLDALTLQLILSYLLVRIDHCASANLFGFFGPLTEADFLQYNCVADRSTAFPPDIKFAQFLAACQAMNKGTSYSDLLFQFKTVCSRTLPQCAFDPIEAACRTLHPELASDARGEVHVVFFRIVVAVAVFRVLMELARLVCVLVAHRRMSNLAVPANVSCCTRGHVTPVYWIAELVGTSIVSPLLYATSRAEFVVLHLQREPAPADFAFRALHAGLLTSIPLLGVNMWYLLRVAQYGVAPAGWLSLMKGMVLVPWLLFQAYRATRPGAGKHQRAGAREEFGIELGGKSAHPASVESPPDGNTALATGSIGLSDMAAPA